MKPNQLKIGSLLSYIQMGVRVIIGILYTPMMTRLLGQNEFGLYQTVASTLSMLSILNLGFNSSYVRYYARYVKEKNDDAISKLNGLFILIFSLIGAVAFICGMYLSFNLKLVFDKGLTDSEYHTAFILMIILTVSMAFSFPMSVFSNIISVHEKYIFLKAVNIIKTVLSPLATIPFLLMGYKSVALATVTVTVTAVTDIIYMLYVIIKLKNRFIFRDFEKGIFKSLLVYTSFIAINLIVDQINWNIDKFLLGRFCGTAAVAVYSIGSSLYGYYQMFSTSISGVFTPRIHKLVVETKEDLSLQKKTLTELFIKVGRIQFIVVGLAATGLILFGKVFITKLWVGAEYNNSYYVMLLLIIGGFTPLIQNIGIEIQRAENKHQFRSIIYLAMAMINLFASIYLCRIWGEIGSAAGTTFSLIVANGIILNIYYHKKCNIDIIAFWKSMKKLAIAMIVPIIYGVIVNKYINYGNSYIVFLAVVCVYTLIYAVSMWFIGMNTYEKQLIEKPIKYFLRQSDKVD